MDDTIQVCKYPTSNVDLSVLDVVYWFCVCVCVCVSSGLAGLLLRAADPCA